VARQLVWSPEAVEDIESIASYIARDSEHYARAVASRLVETGEALTDAPYIGRIVPEVGDENIRERFVHRYRLMYRVEDGRILVVAVIHGSRLLEPLVPRIANEDKSK